MRSFASALILVVLAVSPASASDPLASMRFLVGTWNCTYLSGSARVAYAATFSDDMNGNWIRESDSWKAGSNDLGMFTYDHKNGWTAVFVEPDRTTTVFRASGTNPNHIVYRSVYPSGGMSDIFDRVSPTRFTLHFTQIAAGRTTKSNDVCVKT